MDDCCAGEMAALLNALRTGGEQAFLTVEQVTQLAGLVRRTTRAFECSVDGPLTRICVPIRPGREQPACCTLELNVALHCSVASAVVGSRAACLCDAACPCKAAALYPLSHQDTAVAGSAVAATLLADIAAELVDYSLSNGGVVGTSIETLQHIPATLLPSYVPRPLFDGMQLLASDWNLLVHRIAASADFLTATLAPLADSDPFVAAMLSVYAATAPLRQRPHTALHILRADYMFDAHCSNEDSARVALVPRLVEVNTIAAGALCLSEKVAAWHRYVCSRYFADTLPPDQLASNDAPDRIAEALALAHRAFVAQQQHEQGRRVAVLMIVHPNEFNRNDQKTLEYRLWNNHRVPLVRRSLLELHDQAVLADGAGSALLIGDDWLASVAYYRAGYTPDDYDEAGAAWRARLLVEQSSAIKCPTIGAHLAGCKKVQQALGEAGVVESFFAPHEQATAARLRGVLGGCWALDKDDWPQLLAMVRADPGNYVLKPQREGGGNNLWGQDMLDAMHSLEPAARSAYILMRRISPPARPVAFARAGQLTVAPCISEMGFFGAALVATRADHSVDVLHNQPCGYLVRTKLSSHNEGGIAVGYAQLDSIRFSP